MSVLFFFFTGFVIEGFHAQDEKNETFDVEEMKDLCKIVFVCTCLNSLLYVTRVYKFYSNL